MTNGPEPDRLDELQARIDALKKASRPEPAVVKNFGAADQGWRMVIELVAGLMVGAGLGYGIDLLLGTLPIFLVVLTLLGFGAGVRVMLRTAKEIQDKNARGAAAADEREDDGKRG